MVLRLTGVASESLVMKVVLIPPSLRGALATKQSRPCFWLLDCFASLAMTKLIYRRLLHRSAEARFKEVEIAALIGLLDVAGEHPAVAALEPRLRLPPLRAAPFKLGLGHFEIDAARRDVE